ncbi:unnamed protein product [Adineta ricciae]|uniref:Uncharacterized protein n=1 Tax=Adineta ricciae TaxID=249248 RepID=A0A814PYH6_ADIRI|nr:unnamed protein product [Adineta ricciae]
MNEQHRQGRMFDNSTKLFALITSSTTPSSPVRTRSVINAIYIAGIVFMIIVFLLLLWINLCSRRCWCWHDTPLTNRFNRQWLIKHSIVRNTDIPSRENPQQRRLSGND